MFSLVSFGSFGLRALSSTSGALLLRVSEPVDSASDVNVLWPFFPGAH